MADRHERYGDPAYWAWMEWGMCAAIRNGYRSPGGGLVGARLIERGLVARLRGPDGAVQLTPAGLALIATPKPAAPPIVKGRTKGRAP